MKAEYSIGNLECNISLKSRFNAKNGQVMLFQCDKRINIGNTTLAHSTGQPYRNKNKFPPLNTQTGYGGTRYEINTFELGNPQLRQQQQQHQIRGKKI